MSDSSASDGEAGRAASTWPHHPDPRRWEGIARNYRPEDVSRLRGSVRIEHTLARLGAERLWELLHAEPYVPALGALTGNQAVQMVRAGLKAIYLSGWQVAADGTTAGQAHPDQSLYPADGVPAAVRRINRALQRADQIERAEGRYDHEWFVPIVADAETGFGGPLNAFELMKAMIEAGAAGVHFEDQVASEKKCGHLGGKVLVPTSQFIRTLNAARLAADVMGVPTVLVARTDADSASLILSDVDPRDREFILPGERTPEGFHRMRGGIEAAIARGLAYAPYADVIWCETSTPSLEEARRFAEGIRSRFPEKLLAYDCSPSFDWRKNLDDDAIARFQRELGAMGYRFQFVTLAGFHALSCGTFQLARAYGDRGMAAYTELQQAEFAAESRGYTATRHRHEVGTGYFDKVNEVLSAGQSSTLAPVGSTEAARFSPDETVLRIQRGQDEDHARLDEITLRLRQAHDMESLVAALDDLNAELVEHFAHEEHPQGIFAILGTRSPAQRARFTALLDEHARILVNARALAERARMGGADSERLGQDAGRLLRIIKEHEHRENAAADDVFHKGKKRPKS